MNEIITISALFFQITAIGISLYYYKRMPNPAWILVSIALFVMAIRGLLNLFGFRLEALEVLILIISILIFLGFIFAKKIFKEVDKILKYLKGLWEIDRVIISGLTPKSIINGVKKVIADLFNCDALGIYILHKPDMKLIPYANQNLNEEFHKEMIENKDGLLWKVVKEKKSIFIEKSNKDFDFPNVLKKENCSTFIGVPLILKGDLLGAIILLSNNKTYQTGEVKKYIEGISRQLVIAIDKIQTIEKIKEINIESVFALVQAIEMRDPYTKGHSLQVSNLAVELAKKFECSERELELIKFAGLLHDVGKIAVPENILNKPSSLSEYEWIIMKKHPIFSYEIIKPIKGLLEIEKWILYHHEKWDGSGYPEGLKGSEIPFFSRILAVCDTYSAMLSNRPYRKKLTDEEAREEIKRYAGKQFDPEIVEVFLTLPKESLIKLIEKTVDPS
ncbi:MAG: HD domain-containing phosphohydrolase [candidate division WOR-3 bacterium]